MRIVFGAGACVEVEAFAVQKGLRFAKRRLEMMLVLRYCQVSRFLLRCGITLQPILVLVLLVWPEAVDPFAVCCLQGQVLMMVLQQIQLFQYFFLKLVQFVYLDGSAIARAFLGLPQDLVPSQLQQHYLEC